ncbi:response regulator transcription factor [Terrilactibacillus laevilacticus]|uniref:Response regulator transcription factor n=1 Tax=Terrilactibacillus laevilacticus TaxID=1380157 RepID=A0ABW5PQK4_9BACI|nr:response regulator transcription factor [Terrilactibacillus laevilacticus]
MNKRILIIEDEVQIAKVLKIELQYENYDVMIEYDGRSGLETALNQEFDIILLDIMLPRLNGLEVLKRLRKAENYTPVILLTARDSTFDIVMGLDQGANDYVTKPFEIEELFARIRSLINYNSYLSKSNSPSSILSIQDLVINTETREVKRNGKNITLTPKEYDLIVYLLSHKNKIVTREGILMNVWGYEYGGETNVIDVFIRHLRVKIDEGFKTPLIHTIRGVGYTVREN